MTELIPECPVCDSTRAQVHLHGADHSLAANDFGSSRQGTGFGAVLRCPDCGFGFSRLRPGEDRLAALYREMDIGVYEAETPGRERTARRHFDIVSRHVSPGGLLDVGCASGLFLSLAVDAGWEAVGVEPCRTLCGKAQERLGARADVRCLTLQEADFPPSSFDAITLWDVLEHVPEPVDFLARCRHLLRPSGAVFVNVPDIDSLQARLFGSRWPLLLPEHLNYFNRESLRLCGEKAGLEQTAVGRRPAAFSIGYVFRRLSQHAIPGVKLAERAASAAGLDRWIVPVPMGESYAVCRRPI